MRTTLPIAARPLLGAGAISAAASRPSSVAIRPSSCARSSSRSIERRVVVEAALAASLVQQSGEPSALLLLQPVELAAESLIAPSSDQNALLLVRRHAHVSLLSSGYSWSPRIVRPRPPGAMGRRAPFRGPERNRAMALWPRAPACAIVVSPTTKEAKMHGTLICAVTDGAENDDAVAQAVAISERLGLRLVLTHVVDGIAAATGTGKRASR